jgi:radical SAM protein with 4Fe4S-binding SPASM domain
MAIPDVEKLLSLCRDNGIPMVAWQGGEPLLHSNITEIVKLHKYYDIEAMVFTNALVQPKIIESLHGIVKHVLINCNERSTYSQDEWNLLGSNIKQFTKIIGKQGVALGFNIYDENMDTNFISDMACYYKVEEVRIDMTRPAPSHENTYIPLSHISRMFLKLKKILLQLIEKSIERPHLDCPFPLCALSESDRHFVEKNIYDGIKYGSCHTGIDFSTNMSIHSCFCAPVIKNVSINQFENIWHAWLSIEYLENKIRWTTTLKEECKGCDYYFRRVCQGGCLGSKSNGIGEDNIKRDERMSQLSFSNKS